MREKRLSLLLVTLVFLGFVAIGLPDGLTGVAWPSMRRYFNLPIDALGSLLVSYTIGYLVSSFATGQLLQRVSVGVLLGLSCLATGLSLLAYSASSIWAVVVAFGALAGLGAGAIDAGLNTYAASNFSVRMISVLHAFYGVGALAGPALMAAVLARPLPWQVGYAIVGTLQLLLAAFFALTLRKWADGDRTALASERPRSTSMLATMKLPAVGFSSLVFFFYTGIEAATGIWAFSLLTDARGISMVTAGVWTSIYWAALTSGRVVSAVVSSYFASRIWIRVCIVMQALGTLLLLMQFAGVGNLVALMVIGLASGPIFPSLIASTPERIPANHLANAVGFQIAFAVLGQSLVPALAGVLARRAGLDAIAPMLFVSSALLFLLNEGMTRYRSVPKTA